MVQTQLPPIVSIVGKPKVGKTTFLTKLIPALKGRGYRVGVIKHSVHTFDVAEPGKDTWKHMQAGAETVAFATTRQLVIVRQLEQEMSIDEIAVLMGDVDIILTEGYRRAKKPKIEVVRRQLGTEVMSRREEIIAVVSDCCVDLSVPRFDLDDAAGVADFLTRAFLS